jgi:predicted transcriptional regulator
MLNIRLDEELERKLELMTRKKGITKTALVKEALNQYLNEETIQLTSYELGKDLFDLEEGGSPDGSKNYKEQLKTKLHGKFSH